MNYHSFFSAYENKKDEPLEAHYFTGEIDSAQKNNQRQRSFDQKKTIDTTTWLLASFHAKVFCRKVDSILPHLLIYLICIPSTAPRKDEMITSFRKC